MLQQRQNTKTQSKYNLVVILYLELSAINKKKKKNVTKYKEYIIISDV